jgi:hypothetical protein
LCALRELFETEYLIAAVLVVDKIVARILVTRTGDNLRQEEICRRVVGMEDGLGSGK